MVINLTQPGLFCLVSASGFPVVSEMGWRSGFFRATGGGGRGKGRLWLSPPFHREPQLVPRQEWPAVEEIGLVVHYLLVPETFSEHL